MHFFTSEGIVLNKLKYLESDLIVTILLKNIGKVKAIAKGGANSKKRFPGAFEAGNIGEFSFVEKNFHNLMLLNHAKINNYFIKLKKDYEKIIMLFYILKITDLLLPERQSHPKLFSILAYTLQFLENNKLLHQVRLFYELHLLKENGLLSIIEKCELCGDAFYNNNVYLLVKTGKMICKSCIDVNLEIYPIPLQLLKLMRTIDSNGIDLNEYTNINISPAIFSFTTGIMHAYIDKPIRLWEMINFL